MNAEAEARKLAKRALAHYQQKTSDCAETQMRIPVSAYLDPQRYDREVDRIFKRLPIAVAMSLELPEAGSYVAQSIMGVPVLITRDRDGKVHANLNVCRHRGAIVCPEGRGNRSRFSCPYHAWTYENTGRLVGIYGADTFGEVNRDELSLTNLFCAERSGIIFASLTPGVTFDIDDWLGRFAEQLDTLKLNDWILYEQRDIPGPGWKATLDGYLEVYHHDSVHGKTVGQHTIGNLLVHDTYGPHQRLTFGRKNLPELESIPESEWDAGNYIRIVHSVFPNLSISGILGGHCLVSQVFAGPTPDTTLTRQTILCSKDEQTEAWHEASRQFSAMALQAVRDEDYAIVATIQSALASGANDEFIIGRNEIGIQHYHKNVAAFTREVNDGRSPNGLDK